MGQDERSDFRLNSRLLDGKQKMASPIEGHQAGSGNMGRCVLRIVKELKTVVCSMDDERRNSNLRHSLVRHHGLVVKGDAGAARGYRSHEVDHLIDQGALLCGESRDNTLAGAHQPHQPLAEKLSDDPVENLKLKDRR